MSDPNLEKRIQDYLDGRMASDEIASFEASLERDPALAARVTEYREIGEALRESDTALSPEFFVRTRARFEQERRERTTPPWFRILSWEAAGLVAAAGLAAVLFVPFLWQQEPLPFESPPVPDRQFAKATPSAESDRDDAIAESEVDTIDSELADAGRPAAGDDSRKPFALMEIAADSVPDEPEDQPAPQATGRISREKEAAAVEDSVGAASGTGDEKILEERFRQAAAPAAAAPQMSEKKGRRAASRSEQAFKDEVIEQDFSVKPLAAGVVPRGEVQVTFDDLPKRKLDQTYREGEASGRRVLIGAGPRLLDCDRLTVTWSPEGWRIRVEEAESGSVGCEVRLPGTGGPVEVERIVVDGR